jgi:hypothetical protein
MALRRVLLAAVLVGITLAGCTGDDDDRQGKPKTSPTTTNAGSAPEKLTGVPVKLPQRHVCRDVVPPPAPPGTKPVTIHLACLDILYGSYVVGVTRHVPADAEPFAAAFRELLQGPTPAEREAGLFANFAAEQTGGMLIGARVEGRRAVVDLDPAITSVPVMTNVSTTSGGGGFILPVMATAFGFPGVDQVLFQFAGDADAFWGFLQSSEGVATRARWGDFPKAPVPVDRESGIGDAAHYVGPALERFARAPWYAHVDSVSDGGRGGHVGVRATLDGSPASRQTAAEIGKAVAQLLADSGSFCDTLQAKVSNGPNDSDLLAYVSRTTAETGSCWSDGYEVTVRP